MVGSVGLPAPTSIAKARQPVRPARKDVAAPVKALEPRRRRIRAIAHGSTVEVAASTGLGFCGRRALAPRRPSARRGSGRRRRGDRRVGGRAAARDEARVDQERGEEAEVREQHEKRRDEFDDYDGDAGAGPLGYPWDARAEEVVDCP